ncbi:MAG: hypothetical protein Q9214_005828, partial [Letrouitia sp. 1 TL-2023]
MALRCLMLFFAGFATATVNLYPNNTLITRSSISPACRSAMDASIACDPYLLSLAATNFYGTLNDANLQNAICASACGSSLSSYHNSVQTACKNDLDPWDNVPAVYYGDFIWAHYNLTCIKDPQTQKWCNDYVSDITFPTQDSDLTALPKAQQCSPCIIALIKHLQSTPYSNYDAKLATQWKSIQTTCGLSSPTDPQPPALNGSVAVPGYVQNGTTKPSICQSGNTYQVVSGDTLEKIATAKGVSSGTLRTINGILPDGSNLYAGGTLCLPQTCRTYVVQPNGGFEKISYPNDCAALASSNGISYTQFRAYNPSINQDCTNLLSGTRICVGLPGLAYNGTTIGGATITKTDQYASSTVAPPTNVATGTTRKCGKYYNVQPGEICEKVALNNSIGTTSQCYQWHVVKAGDYCYAIQQTYGITFAQLQQWNPSIDDTCGSLVIGDAYCVQGPSSSAGARMAQARPTAQAKTTGNSKSTAQLKPTAQPKPTETKKQARAVKYE